MLLTGSRTHLGIKLYGKDLEVLQEESSKIENILKKYEGSMSVSADKINQGYYLNIKIDDEEISRYNINKNTILETFSIGVGAEQLTQFL